MNKLLLHEYGRPENITELAESLQITPQNLKTLIKKANDRIISALSLSSNPLVMDADTVRAINIAGTIRLSARIELEVVPKYLGFSDNDVHWKENFYLLSTLSKHGKLLEGDNIHAASAFKSSLFDIAGRALAEGFVPLRRQLLRQYRRNKFDDYCIEGEIRFEDAFSKLPNGIPQENVKFDKQNDYNATILAAMRYVQPHVTEPRIQRILEESITVLAPQKQFRLDSPRLSLPGRDLRWKSEYDLAYDIIHGMGAAFTDGSVLSPGFMVSTWQIWEWLISTAVRLGEPNYRVASQKPFPFGVLNNEATGGQQQLYVYPDIAAINSSTSDIVYLVDAKYKRLAVNSSREVDRSDIYEALAFCQKARCDSIFLAYPCEHFPGQTIRISLVESYCIDSKVIYIIQIPVQNLTSPGGLRAFSNMVAEGINSILNPRFEF